MTSKTLLDKNYIRKVLTVDDPWVDSHGAEADYLGIGLLYYTLVYMSQAITVVCLGSGGGFVPRILRQAQRDLGLADSRTILVDADIPEAGWQSPIWLEENAPFRKNFPEIEIRIEKTEQAFNQYFKPNKIQIDYLHIDADHSYEGCLNDFVNYSQLLSDLGMISFHDTSITKAKIPRTPCIGVPKVVEFLRTQSDWEIIDFEHIACGVAVAKRKSKLRFSETI